MSGNVSQLVINPIYIWPDFRIEMSSKINRFGRIRNFEVSSFVQLLFAPLENQDIKFKLNGTFVSTNKNTFWISWNTNAVG